MNDLMLFERKDRVLVSSRVVADRFAKRHYDVMLAIENKLKTLTTENFVVEDYFIKSQYEHNGNIYDEYLLTRDGFSFVVMGFTGREADVWKLKYIQAFNSMEACLRDRLSTDWLITRKQGRLVRRNETDALARLIEYAETQGSRNMRKTAYVTYTKLVNALVGIEAGQRDTIPFKTLSAIMFLEDMILHTVAEEMRNGTFYKDIYKKCKRNGEQIMRFAYLPSKAG